MTYGVRLTTDKGEQLAMPGWSLNIEARPPCVFKGDHKIELPWKGLDTSITDGELAEIRRQYEAFEAL
jgi:hypothetical protein